MGSTIPSLPSSALATNAVRGDLGTDPAASRHDLVLERLPRTMQLVAVILFCLWFCHPAGGPAPSDPPRLTAVARSRYRSPRDFGGLILILVFAVQLGIFRTSGYGGWQFWILPAITLAARSIGQITLITRSAMIDELCQPYLATARAKGLNERKVVVNHALRNATIPIITLSAWQIARMVAGLTVAVETVFAWPGEGLLAIHAIKRRDLPLIHSDVYVVALVVVVINLILDILYGFFDPRIVLAEHKVMSRTLMRR
jgi:peptide/nickel transport system permease protein